jgi:hypothetical protein
MGGDLLRRAGPAGTNEFDAVIQHRRGRASGIEFDVCSAPTVIDMTLIRCSDSVVLDV